MKQRGFTLIELLVLIAILGVIAAVVALNVGDFFGRGGNETATNNLTPTNETLFQHLAAQPVSSLNITELVFMANYCADDDRYSASSGYMVAERATPWLLRAQVYQNQIIINELQEHP